MHLFRRQSPFYEWLYSKVYSRNLGSEHRMHFFTGSRYTQQVGFPPEPTTASLKKYPQHILLTALRNLPPYVKGLKWSQTPWHSSHQEADSTFPLLNLGTLAGVSKQQQKSPHTDLWASPSHPEQSFQESWAAAWQVLAQRPSAEASTPHRKGVTIKTGLSATQACAYSYLGPFRRDKRPDKQQWVTSVNATRSRRLTSWAPPAQSTAHGI